MIDNHFRAVLPRYAAPIIWLYGRLGLTPNAISVSAVVIAAAAAYTCAGGNFLAAALLWWLGRLGDGTDGIYARATGQATDFGAYLDIVCDMAAYSLMLFGFNARFPALGWTWLATLFLYVLCITSALALGSIEGKQGQKRRDNRGLRLGAGLAEGGETGIAYTLFLLLPQHIGVLSLMWLGVLSTTIIARSVLAKRLLHAGQLAAAVVDSPADSAI